MTLETRVWHPETCRILGRQITASVAIPRRYALFERVVGQRYRTEVVIEAEHTRNIAALAAAGSEKFGPVLHESRLRFGIAQELLNLYLKYLLVTDQITERRHYPIDGRITQRAKLRYQWTSSDSEAEYVTAIAALRGGLAGNHMAAWELHAFEEERR